MLALVDGDVLIHNVFHLSENFEVFKKKYHDTLESWLLLSFSTDCKVALKGGNNFRDEISTDYKKSPSRMKQRETLQGTYINDAYLWAAEQVNACRAPFGEADDLLHCWASRFRYRPYYVIISVDKDLMQVPGHHYNPRQNRYSVQSWKDSVDSFCTQMLQGDTIDNIPGCKGIGPVKAKRIVEAAESPGVAVIEKYKQLYGSKWEEEFLFNGSLLYLVRSIDDSFSLQLFIKRYIKGRL